MFRMGYVCTKCGLEFGREPDRCSKCGSAAVFPWAMIPAYCWDCGAPIHTPPHKREYLGQCAVCAAGADRKRAKGRN